MNTLKLPEWSASQTRLIIINSPGNPTGGVIPRKEIDEYNRQESFNKKDPVTDWERKNTLDC